MSHLSPGEKPKPGRTEPAHSEEADGVKCAVPSNSGVEPDTAYNSLTDRHLAGYFSNTRIRRHLQRAGLITRSGRIVPDKEYRHKLIQRAHQRHVRECLAQAIFHKVLEMERAHQIEIKRKLEEFARRERVHKIKVERSKRYEEDIIRILSPRPPTGARCIRKQHSGGPEGEHSETSESPGSSRPNTAPGKMQRPVRLKPIHSSSTTASLRRSSPSRVLENDNEQPLSCTMASRGLVTTAEVSRGISPYCLPVINSFVTPVPPATKRRDGAAKVTLRGRRLRPTTADVNEDPPMLRSSVHQSRVCVNMTYFGKTVHLSHDLTDMRDEVKVFQQHCGGENLCVFKGKLREGETFQFVSRRHRGFPFSLTFFLNGLQLERLSSCCEFKHRKGSRLGGRHGHFGFSGVEGASPCYKCIIAMGLDKKPTPPPKRVKEDGGREESVSSPKDAPEMEVERTGDDAASQSEGETSRPHVTEETAAEGNTVREDYEEDFEADDEGPAEDVEVKEEKSSAPSGEGDTPVKERDSETEDDDKDEDMKSHSGSSSSGSDRQQSDAEATSDDEEAEENTVPPDGTQDEANPAAEAEPSDVQNSAGESTEVDVPDPGGPSGNENNLNDETSGDKELEETVDESKPEEEQERAKSVQEKLAEAILKESRCSSEPELSDTSTEEEESTDKGPEQDSKDAVKCVTFTEQQQTRGEERQYEERVAEQDHEERETLVEESDRTEDEKVEVEEDDATAASEEDRNTTENDKSDDTGDTSAALHPESGKEVNEDDETSEPPGEAVDKSTDGEAAVKSTDGEAAVKSTDGEAAVKSTDGEAAVKSTDGEAAVKSTDGEAAVKSTDGEAAVKSTDGEAEVKSTDGEAAVKSTDGEAAVKSTDGEAAVKSTDDEAAVKSTDGEAAVKSTDGEAAVKSTDGEAAEEDEENEEKTASEADEGAKSVKEDESSVSQPNTKTDDAAAPDNAETMTASETMEMKAEPSEEREALSCEEASATDEEKRPQGDGEHRDEATAENPSSSLEGSGDANHAKTADTSEDDAKAESRKDGMEEGEAEDNQQQSNNHTEQASVEVDDQVEEKCGEELNEEEKQITEGQNGEENETDEKEKTEEEKNNEWTNIDSNAEGKANEEHDEKPHSEGDKEEKVDESEKTEADGDGECVKNTNEEEEPEVPSSSGATDQTNECEKINAAADEEQDDEAEKGETEQTEHKAVSVEAAEGEERSELLEELEKSADADLDKDQISDENVGESEHLTEGEAADEACGSKTAEETPNNAMEAEGVQKGSEAGSDGGEKEKVDAENGEICIGAEDESPEDEGGALSENNEDGRKPEFTEIKEITEEHNVDEAPGSDVEGEEEQDESSQNEQPETSGTEINQESKADDVNQTKQDENGNMSDPKNDDGESDFIEMSDNIPSTACEVMVASSGDQVAPVDDPDLKLDESTAPPDSKTVDEDADEDAAAADLPAADGENGADEEEASKASEEGASVLLKPHAQSSQLPQNQENTVPAGEDPPEAFAPEDNTDLVTNWVTMHQTSKYFETFVEPLEDLKESDAEVSDVNEETTRSAELQRSASPLEMAKMSEDAKDEIESGDKRKEGTVASNLESNHSEGDEKHTETEVKDLIPEPESEHDHESVVKGSSGSVDEDAVREGLMQDNSELTDISKTQVESIAGSRRSETSGRAESASENQKAPDSGDQTAIEEVTDPLPSSKAEEDSPGTEELSQPNANAPKDGEETSGRSDERGGEVTEITDFIASKSDDGNQEEFHHEDTRPKPSDGSVDGDRRGVQLIQDIKHTLSKDRLGTFSVDETLFGPSSHPLLTAARTESGH